MVYCQYSKQHVQSIIVGNVIKFIENLTKIQHDLSLQRQGLQNINLKMLEKSR